MKEVIVAFLVALVVGAFINGFAAAGGSSTAPAATSTVAPDGAVSSAGNELEVTDATFDDEVLKSAQPVLVDFYAPECAVCKEMAPVINEIASTYGGRLKIVKVDTDANPRVSMQYSVNVLPAYILFKNGDKGETFTGLVPKAILAQAVDKALQ